MLPGLNKQPNAAADAEVQTGCPKGVEIRLAFVGKIAPHRRLTAGVSQARCQQQVRLDAGVLLQRPAIIQLVLKDYISVHHFGAKCVGRVLRLGAFELYVTQVQAQVEAMRQVTVEVDARAAVAFVEIPEVGAVVAPVLVSAAVEANGGFAVGILSLGRRARQQRENHRDKCRD